MAKVVDEKKAEEGRKAAVEHRRVRGEAIRSGIKSLRTTEVTYQRLRSMPTYAHEARELFGDDVRHYLFMGHPVIIVDEKGEPVEGEMEEFKMYQDGAM